MTSGGYYWVREIAQGGMGRVDLVVRSEGSYRRPCAVKRLHGVLRDEPDCRAMFLDEARIAGLLEHVNVVRVFDVGEDAEGPFLMMDFVDGATVRGLLLHVARKNAEVPVSVVLEVVLQAAEGLHAAHELRGSDGASLELVHRDVSPQNIMVGHDGVVRVMDFGVARALGRTSRTSTGVLKGKFGYMSPEQLQFRSPDRRSDLFALGVVLYEMLTLSRLYSNRDGTGPRRILDEAPPDVGLERSDLPPQLVELVFQLLAKDPDKRPGTAADIASRLREMLADLMFVDEQALELKDYMGLEFATQAEEQRAELSAAYARLDRDELPRWPVAVQPSILAQLSMSLGSEDVTVTELAPRSRPRWLLAVALGLVAAGAIGLGLYLGRAPEAVSEPSPTTASAPELVAPAEPVAEAAPAPVTHPAPATQEPPAVVVAAPADDIAPTKRRRRRRPPTTPPETSAPAATMTTSMRDPLAPAAFGSIGGDSP